MKKLIGFALLIGVVLVVAKVLADQKARWAGLTEAEVRAKLDERLPEKVPAEKRSVIADTVVSKMRDRGALADSPGAEPSGNGSAT